MRKLIATTMASLDGVMQAPGGPGEDPSGGFALGGWSFSYWAEVSSMNGLDGKDRVVLDVGLERLRMLQIREHALAGCGVTRDPGHARLQGIFNGAGCDSPQPLSRS